LNTGPEILDRTAIEEQLERVLASSPFAASKQLREFLRYVGEAALSGRDHLDQTEIAERLLARGANFNPLDDSTVRKLATLTRQKLGSYYETAGIHDAILITLPYRTYVPQFQPRVSGQMPSLAIPAVEEPVAVSEKPAVVASPPRKRSLVVVGGLMGVVGILLLLLPAKVAKKDAFELKTVRGEFRGLSVDLPQGGVMLGPEIGENDEATVRMRFSPEQDMHHAGLLIWENADSYVKLGRRFQDRSSLEFAYEEHGRFHSLPDSDRYDFEGQTGAPIWLSIRRKGRSFRAFTSADGTQWTPFGTSIELAEDLKKPRIGIFAINGRREAASIDAVFDRLSLGFTSANWPDVQDIADAGWALESSSCRSAIEMQIAAPLLLFKQSVPKACSVEFLHWLPAGDATVSTRIDFAPFLGSMAGLVIRGSKGGARIARGEEIRFFFDGHYVIDQPDWRGRPPLFIRLNIRGGLLNGEYSRDDSNYREFAAHVPVAELGDNLRYGLRFNLVQNGVNPTPLGVFHIRREIRGLESFRSN
jgi:hypothetical protein